MPFPSLTVKDLAREVAAGVITPNLLQEFDPQVVREVKEGLRQGFRGISACVREMDAEKALVTYAATVECIDRMGDLVLTRPRKSIARPMEDGTTNMGEGFLTANHKAAGAPFLWSHLSYNHAVGQVENSRQARIDTPRDGKVWSTLQDVRYLVDERIPHAVPTWILVEAGIAKSVSIGFAAMLAWWPDDAIRKKLGMPYYGIIFLTSDQTELSQAQTPACQLALAQKAEEDAGATERASIAALEKAVSEKRRVGGVEITQALVSDFRREFPLGPGEERDFLRGRIEGFFDLHEVSDELERIFADEARKAIDEEEEEQETETRSADEEVVLTIPEGSAPIPVRTRGVEIPVQLETLLAKRYVEALGSQRETDEAVLEEAREFAAEYARELDRRILEGDNPGPEPRGIQRSADEEDSALATLGRIAQAAGLDLESDLADVEREVLERISRSAEPPATTSRLRLAPGDQLALSRAYDAASEAIEALAELYERASDSEARGLDSSLPAHTFGGNEDAARSVLSIVRKLESIERRLGIGGVEPDDDLAADRQRSVPGPGPTLLADLF